MTLRDKLLTALSERPGETIRVYIRKRPVIDWAAVRVERQQGISAASLAARLGVSERTVIRHAPKK